MDTTLLILIIVGITALTILSLVLLYSISLIRRTNIVMKKLDYLVEDITYKSESLNIAVEAINKISNYVLTFDTLTKKGFKSISKLVSENRNYFYSLAEKLKETKKQPTAKKATSKTTETKLKTPKTTTKTTETKLKTPKTTKKTVSK